MAQRSENGRQALRVGAVLCMDAFTSSGVLLLKAGRTIENEQQLLRLSQPDVIFFKRTPRIEMIEAVGRAVVESAMQRGELRPPDFTQRLRRAASAKYELVHDVGSIYSALETGGDVDIELTQRVATRLTEEMSSNSLALMSLTRLKDADNYTFTHSVNVAIIAMYVAMASGLVDDPLDLGMGALLHDIGKIGTPGSILRKAGPLTDIEMLIVQEHPGYGADLLRGQGYTNDVVLACVGDHHETLTGTGYPNGKAGDEIGLCARLTCLADVFDAITTDRPYHKAITPAEALQIMAQDTNERFDPALLGHLVDILRRLPDNQAARPISSPAPPHPAPVVTQQPVVESTAPIVTRDMHFDAFA